MSAKLEILDLIEKGEISPEEGARRLQELAGNAEEQAPQPSTQLEILGMIERGEITADEGVQRLSAPPPAITSTQTHADSGPTYRELPPEMEEQIKKWQSWWMIPVWIGISLILLGAWWMSSSFQNAGGVNFWFFCAWLPLLIGIGLAALAWPSPNRTWLHVRIREDKEDHKQRVNISMPLPLKLASWGFRTFKHRIPDDVRDKLDASAIDEVLTTLGSSASQGTPFYVQVEEDDGSEKVEVFIG
jgi:hypothetical protein